MRPESMTGFYSWDWVTMLYSKADAPNLLTCLATQGLPWRVEEDEDLSGPSQNPL